MSFSKKMDEITVTAKTGNQWKHFVPYFEYRNDYILDGPQLIFILVKPDHPDLADKNMLTLYFHTVSRGKKTAITPMSAKILDIPAAFVTKDNINIATSYEIEVSVDDARDPSYSYCPSHKKYRCFYLSVF